jgi:hypothetical protein
MKHINKIQLVNESIKPQWEKEVVSQLKYDRAEDLSLFFIELLDLNWIEDKVLETVSGEDFKLDPQRMSYLKNPLYQTYVLRFKTGRLHSMNVFIEIMDIITESLERIRDDGYVFKVIDLSLGRKKEKIFEVAIYHSDDKVDFESIFIKKDKR